jgi:hypothetical protein
MAGVNGAIELHFRQRISPLTFDERLAESVSHFTARCGGTIKQGIVETDDIRVVLVRREVVAGLRISSTPGHNNPANLEGETVNPLGAPGRIARSDRCSSCSK